MTDHIINEYVSTYNKYIATDDSSIELKTLHKKLEDLQKTFITQFLLENGYDLKKVDAHYIFIKDGQ